MRTIVWWAIWGLVVSAGLIGLMESTPHHMHLLIAFPLLTGAGAAAFVRLKYEYHHAVQHAKWLVVSSLFMIGGLGYLYAKANAYGPFATGTACKAFLGTTFEMSVPEAERALGRRMTEQEAEKPLPERAQDWLLETLPLPGHPADSSFTMPLIMYRTSCKSLFLFKNGKLGRVEVEFEPVAAGEADGLVAKIREELEKDYRPAEASAARSAEPRFVFRKESTEAAIDVSPAPLQQSHVRVTLQYLPFLDTPAPALSVEANAF